MTSPPPPPQDRPPPPPPPQDRPPPPPPPSEESIVSRCIANALDELHIIAPDLGSPLTEQSHVYIVLTTLENNIITDIKYTVDIKEKEKEREKEGSRKLAQSMLTYINKYKELSDHQSSVMDGVIADTQKNIKAQKEQIEQITESNNEKERRLILLHTALTDSVRDVKQAKATATAAEARATAAEARATEAEKVRVIGTPPLVDGWVMKNDPTGESEEGSGVWWEHTGNPSKKTYIYPTSKEDIKAWEKTIRVDISDEYLKAIATQYVPINDYREAIDEQSAHIKELEDANALVTEELIAKENKIAEQGKKIAEQGNNIVEQSAHIKKLEDTKALVTDKLIAEQEKKIAEQGNTIDEQGNTIVELEAAAKAAQDELNPMLMINRWPKDKSKMLVFKIFNLVSTQLGTIKSHQDSNVPQTLKAIEKLKKDLRNAIKNGVS